MLPDDVSTHVSAFLAQWFLKRRILTNVQQFLIISPWKSVLHLNKFEPFYLKIHCAKFNEIKIGLLVLEKKLKTVTDRRTDKWADDVEQNVTRRPHLIVFLWFWFTVSLDSIFLIAIYMYPDDKYIFNVGQMIKIRGDIFNGKFRF